MDYNVQRKKHTRKHCHLVDTFEYIAQDSTLAPVFTKCGLLLNMHNIHKTLRTLIFIQSNLCASKWHALYHIEKTWQIKEATTDSKVDLRFVKLVISWALPSRQQHRVTSGRIAQSPFFHTSWKIRQTITRKTKKVDPNSDHSQHQTLPSHKTVS